jgi:hypothetical protein
MKTGPQFSSLVQPIDPRQKFRPAKCVTDQPRPPRYRHLPGRRRRQPRGTRLAEGRRRRRPLLLFPRRTPRFRRHAQYGRGHGLPGGPRPPDAVIRNRWRRFPAFFQLLDISVDRSSTLVVMAALASLIAVRSSSLRALSLASFSWRSSAAESSSSFDCAASLVSWSGSAISVSFSGGFLFAVAGYCHVPGLAILGRTRGSRGPEPQSR